MKEVSRERERRKKKRIERVVASGNRKSRGITLEAWAVLGHEVNISINTNVKKRVSDDEERHEEGAEKVEVTDRDEREGVYTGVKALDDLNLELSGCADA